MSDRPIRLDISTSPHDHDKVLFYLILFCKKFLSYFIVLLKPETKSHSSSGVPKLEAAGHCGRVLSEFRQRFCAGQVNRKSTIHQGTVHLNMVLGRGLAT